MKTSSWPYSHITARTPFRWPNGAGLALYVAVGVEHYRLGGGHVENILEGVPQPDHVNTAWRDYGNRVGGFRLLDRLAERGVRPAVLLNTDAYDTAPELLQAARDAGAEMVAHGTSNSDCLADMAPHEERAYVQAVAERMRAVEGMAPRGWSSPWLAHTDNTFDALAGAGYEYLLDLRMDDQPVTVPTASSPLLAIPYALELNDSSTMVGRRASAQDFAQMVIDEFDELLGASSQQAVVMSVVLHTFVSGVPFRLRALTRALDHILAHQDRIWLATPGEIADAASRDGVRPWGRIVGPH